MNLLLSEMLPLRTTRALGSRYAEDAVLPHRYGDLREAWFKAVRIDDDRWLIADHVFQVTEVATDEQPTLGWNQAIESDGRGRSWTVIRLAAPAPQSSVVWARGIGKLKASTGALIENPADVFEDIVALAGRVGSWPLLRSECAAVNLVVAGSLDEKISIRSALDLVGQSVGAIWTMELATLYPSNAPAGFIRDLSGLEVDNISITASIEDSCDSLRIGYNREDSTNQAQSGIELQAKPQLLGGVVAEALLPWLRKPDNAESVGRRLLQRKAGERYSVAFSTSATDIRPCWWVRLRGLDDWPFDEEDDPIIKVLSVDIDLTSNSAKVVGEYLRSAPRIVVSSYSAMFPSTRQSSIEVAFDSGVAVITIFDEDRRIIVGARVALDGGLAKMTDSQGHVSFFTTKGLHRLAIEAPGYVPFTMEIVL